MVTDDEPSDANKVTRLTSQAEPDAHANARSEKGAASGQHDGPPSHIDDEESLESSKEVEQEDHDKIISNVKAGLVAMRAAKAKTQAGASRVSMTGVIAMSAAPENQKAANDGARRASRDSSAKEQGNATGKTFLVPSRIQREIRNSTASGGGETTDTKSSADDNNNAEAVHGKERGETICGITRSKKCWIIFIVNFLLIVAIAVVGAIMVAGSGGGDSDKVSPRDRAIVGGVSGDDTSFTPTNTPVQLEQPSSAPIQMSAAPVVSTSTTNAPSTEDVVTAPTTQAPTLERALFTPQPTPEGTTRFQTLLNRIGPTLVAPGGDTSILTNPFSLEFEALQWLANSDLANLPISVTPQRILVERYTLALLYISSSGASWVNQFNFLSVETVCNWNDGKKEGVFCMGSFVNEISMPENNIQGSFPSEMGLLDQLQYLDLDLNSLTGTLPEQLSSLTDLVRFRVFGNGFSGTIPRGIGTLSVLTELDMTANALTGIVPPDMGGLLELQYALLGSNRLRGQLPSELGLLTNLVELYLYENLFSGVVPMSFSNLIQLTELGLETNQLTGGLDTLFCNRGDLEVFTADCTAQCNCCTEACSA